MPKASSRQFRALYRFSLARLVDLEIISSRGDLQGLFARSGGVLFALSLMLAGVVVTPYARHALKGLWLATQGPATTASF